LTPWDVPAADIDAEPVVLLLIGTDKQTDRFTNLATGCKTSYSFISLNGYHDTANIHIEKKTSLHALYLDINDNKGDRNKDGENDNKSKLSIIITSVDAPTS